MKIILSFIHAYFPVSTSKAHSKYLRYWIYTAKLPVQLVNVMNVYSGVSLSKNQNHRIKFILENIFENAKYSMVYFLIYKEIKFNNIVFL